MNGVELSRIDLNLLAVLATLLDEGSVTRAAARLGRTQSAVSHALDRLRELLGDPLFVRAGQRLAPTPRADELREPVRRLTGELVALMRSPAAFDASATERTFTLAASDYLQAVLLPPLVRAMRAAAPGATLLVTGPRRRLPERLGRGELDFALAVQLDDLSSLHAAPLFDDEFACLVDANHPATRGALDLETYVRHPHALVAPLGSVGGHVDRALERLGATRRVAVLVPSFMVAPSVLVGTDLVLTLPRRVASRLVGPGLRLLTPPIALPRLRAHLVWHDRLTRDPAAAWLRALVRETAAGLDEPTGGDEPTGPAQRDGRRRRGP